MLKRRHSEARPGLPALAGVPGITREPGSQERLLSMGWPVFMGSGPGPEGLSRNDSRVFRNLLVDEI
jgi:hypothetical protein